MDKVRSTALASGLEMNHLRSAGYRTCVAGYESERLLPRGEAFDRALNAEPPQTHRL